MKTVKIGKKILTAILMMAVMVGMGLAAFAGETSDTYSITITNAEADHAYTAYQIFKGDVSDGSIGNIEWGSGITANGRNAIYTHYGLNDADQTAAKAAAAIASFNAGGSAATEDDARAVELANTIGGRGSYTGGKASTYDETAGTATISGLAPGYYLVIDSKEPDGYNSSTVDPAYSMSRKMVQLVGENVTIINKVVQPGVDKKIVVDDEDKTETVAAIGETVTFKITSAVPNCEGYKNYVMTFDDTMGKGLTFDENSLVVTVGEQTLTKGTDYTLTTVNPYTPTSYRELYGKGTSIQIEMKIKENNEDQKYTFGETITITYDAELNGDATIVGLEGKKANYDNSSESISQNYNPNKVKLKYSDNPNSDSFGETKEVEVHVWTFEFQIVKTKNLANYYWYIDTVGDAKAEFELYADEACTQKIELKKDRTHLDAYWHAGSYYAGKLYSPVYRPLTAKEKEDGITGDVIKAGTPYVAGLKNGTYYLLETKAPDGYTLMSPNPREIKIEDRSIDASFLGAYGHNGGYENDPYPYSEVHNDYDYYYERPAGYEERKGHFHAYDYSNGGIHVIDEAGSTLPSTGGIGTTIFYVIGAILVIGAGVLLVTRKRTDAVK